MHALIVTCLVLVIALTASPVAGQEADALRRELDQMRRGFETMKEQYQKSIEIYQKSIQLAGDDGAIRQGMGRSLEELATEPKVIEAVQAGIDDANNRLARVEQIKKFAVVPGDWAPGGDELTPTMKLKRRPIDRKYAEEIEAMYAS